MASDWIVLKFGGTSVSSRENWETIASVIDKRRDSGKKVMVVCSALSGISNLIEGLVKGPVKNDYEEDLDQISARHKKLCGELEIDFERVIGDEFRELVNLFKGIALLGEISPRTYAIAMSKGELMSTKMGAEFLRRRGTDVNWMDAREWMYPLESHEDDPSKAYLSVQCDSSKDEKLIGELSTKAVIITQGFIAKNGQGDTVLLGRGGSDTSAAIFAAKIDAARCEIWTDIPGIFTADPRKIPDAFLLKQLEYEEAQEMATTGAKILHPKCIEPLAQINIPIHICALACPDYRGTVINSTGERQVPRVKGIAMKKGIQLLSIETVHMWQQVGYLADIFQCFKKHQVSIDLISTSETNVTLSFDPSAQVLSQKRINDLIEDLQLYGEVKHIAPCASISLVGKKIRAIMHQLAGALQIFEEYSVYLMSQAANDLNLTLVVNEETGEQLLKKLHAQLFRDYTHENLLGPSIKEIMNPHEEEFVTPSITEWWKERKDELIELASTKGPLYVYHLPTIEEAANSLKDIKAVDKIFYAMKANPHPEVLRTLEKKGLGIECVSQQELQHVFNLFPSLDPERVLFTPNFCSKEEYAFALEKGCYVTVDNVHPLKSWADLFKGKKIILRLDPGEGAGHHRYVQTAGAQSKFGLSPEQLASFIDLASDIDCKVIGLHAHVGSGIFSLEKWKETATFLATMAERFPHVQFLNLGGGIGVPERFAQTPLDLKVLASYLNDVKEAYPQYNFWIEPGRYLVARAGALLARVTQLKEKEGHRYVGIETGMNSLIRPGLYGAFHEIVNLNRLDYPLSMKADIVGPICETGDTLGHRRKLPVTFENDVLCISTVGAYGRAMSSHYNLRPPAAEHTLR